MGSGSSATLRSDGPWVHGLEADYEVQEERAHFNVFLDLYSTHFELLSDWD
jgi:hypothetical protein